MTPELRKARAATLRVDQAQQARDEAIRAAAVTHSLREIALAVGLSKPRIHQIVREGQGG